MKILSKKADTETKVSKKLVDKKAEEYTSKYRNQIKQKEKDLLIIKDTTLMLETWRRKSKTLNSVKLDPEAEMHLKRKKKRNRMRNLQKMPNQLPVRS